MRVIWGKKMDKTVTFFANGNEIKAKEGEILLRALLENGIDVPHFCYHDALGVDGNCRMCMVEIEGFKRPQVSCDTEVQEGMVVRTIGANINEVKRSILELELINHPVDCPICDQAGECKLQDYYMQMGLYDSRLTTQKVHKNKHIDLGSSVMLDQERCVLCARCSRFTSNITKTGELGIMGRGDHSYLGTMPNKKLDNPYAMNVVDLCPVGALTSRDFRFKQRVWFLKSAGSICQECEKGCNITIDHNKEKYKEDVIYRFKPRVNKNINGYFMCDFGRLSYKKQSENRQEEFLISGEKKESFEVLNKLKNLLELHKGAISILISPSSSLEEMMTVKILAKRCEAEIFCDFDSYLDGKDDDFLIKAQKASNKKGAQLLGINSGDYKKNSLIININHKKIIKDDGLTVEFLTHKKENNAYLVLPIAYFTEQKGSVINSDGYIQRMERAITKENMTLLDIVQIVLEEEISFDFIWQELQKIDRLNGISWDKIGKLGTKVL